MNKKMLAYSILILTLIIIFASNYILKNINLGFFLVLNTKTDAGILIGLLISICLLIYGLKLFFYRPIKRNSLRNADSDAAHIVQENFKTKVTSKKKINILQLLSVFYALFYLAMFLIFLYRCLFVKDPLTWKLYCIIGYTIISIVVTTGLFCMKRWAWFLGILFSVLQLVWFPWGAIAGIFLLSILLIYSPSMNAKIKAKSVRQKKEKIRTPISKRKVNSSISLK